MKRSVARGAALTAHPESWSFRNLREPRRLAALRQLALLDTPAEEAFDRLTRLAARILRAPVALVSLVDADRQFVKSSVGLPEPLASRREMPLSHSFCHHTVELGTPLVIEDARRHAEFRDHPAVQLSVVAYAGIPLLNSDGYALGTLCVVDSEPRSWNIDGFDLLRDLAASVMTEIELRLAVRAVERRQAEVERERSERLVVLERISEGAMALDDKLCITFVNPAAERLLQRSRAELIGHAFWKAFPKITETAAYGELRRALAGRTPVHCGLYLHPDTWIELHAHPAEAGSWLYFRDVTEQKETEEALRRSEEQLRHSQRLEAMGRLAGGIAHDFNNVLMVIRGHAELMLDALRSSDPLADEVREIRKAADRAAGLTRQLLAFSRKQVLQPKVLDLREVVREMEKMLRRILGEDVELETVVGEEACRTRADPGQLEQVLMNLAVNARDAMPGGGRLVIEARCVELEREAARPYVEAGAYVLLRVSDTGVGMSGEVREKVFEPFFTTKEAGKGTGLGLSTVYGIVKQSGGYIWVESEAGVGSTFQICLPRIEAAAEAAEAARPELRRAAPGTETILLVEDDEMVHKLSYRVLTTLGYTVLAAASGPEALARAEQHGGAIDLLLTDVVMPEMSGETLAARLAEARPGIRVLYTSGFTESEVAQRGALGDGSAFLEKPFTPVMLGGKVREVLDGG